VVLEFSYKGISNSPIFVVNFNLKFKNEFFPVLISILSNIIPGQSGKSSCSFSIISFFNLLGSLMSQLGDFLTGFNSVLFFSLLLDIPNESSSFFIFTFF